MLSFGEEAEEDEEETNTFVKKIAGKAKSTHDVLDDPLLSKETLKIEKNSKIIIYAIALIFFLTKYSYR